MTPNLSTADRARKRYDGASISRIPTDVQCAIGAVRRAA